MELGLGVWVGFNYKESNRMSADWSLREYYRTKYTYNAQYGSRFLYLVVI